MRAVTPDRRTRCRESDPPGGGRAAGGRPETAGAAARTLTAPGGRPRRRGPATGLRGRQPAPGRRELRSPGREARRGRVVPTPRVDAETLIGLVAGIARELRPGDGSLRVDLDTDLYRDLGLDSLARMELLARLERAAGTSLPDRALAEAATPRELLHAFASVRPSASAPGPGMAAGQSRTGVVVGAGAASPARETAVQPEPDAVPADAETLIDALAWHAAEHPEREHVRLVDESESETVVTFGALLDGARRVAAGLVRSRLTPGRSVAIMLPTGADYLRSFLGIQLAGGVPLPIYPPARLAQLEDHLRRHERILDNAGAEWLITFDEARRVSRLLAARADGSCRVATVGELTEAGESDREPELILPGPDDIAFLQYTSGSTGQPKGVVLTHRNVLASLKSMAEALSATPRDVFVSWLPLYHDLGLIAAWLGSVVYGFPLVLMSPLTFLARPARWLRAIHRHRGTLSGGPNFGVRPLHASHRGRRDRGPRPLELADGVQRRGAGAPRYPSRIRGALRALRLRIPAPSPPSMGLPRRPSGSRSLPSGGDRSSNGWSATPWSVSGARSRRARKTRPRSGASRAGVPIPGFEVRTVDDGGRETPERVEGRLQFRGPSTTSGYFRDPAATAALFDGDWLESGDLAYVAGGEVYITGRVKDVIIRAGRNLYPYDFEQAAGDLEGVRRGCVALFSAHAPAGTASAGTERLVAVAETRASDPARQAEIRAALEALSEERLGQPMDEVVLAPPHTVLKTSSGKIRRRAMADLYESGGLGAGRAASRPLWLRLARLAAGGAGPALRRSARRIGEIRLRGMGVGGARPGGDGSGPRRNPRPPAALRIRLRGGRRPHRLPARRRPADRRGRRAPPPGWGVRRGLEPHELPRRARAGRGSPRARSASSRRRSFGTTSSRAGSSTGSAPSTSTASTSRRSVAHAGGLSVALGAGETILIFAEGTLHRMPGLLPFQTGGFMAAVETEGRGRAGRAPRHAVAHAGPDLVPAAGADPRPDRRTHRPAARVGAGPECGRRTGREGAEQVVAGGSTPRCDPGMDARPLRRARPRQPEPPPRPHRAPHRHRDLNLGSGSCSAAGGGRGPPVRRFGVPRESEAGRRLGAMARRPGGKPLPPRLVQPAAEGACPRAGYAAEYPESGVSAVATRPVPAPHPPAAGCTSRGGGVGRRHRRTCGTIRIESWRRNGTQSISSAARQRSVASAPRRAMR